MKAVVISELMDRSGVAFGTSGARGTVEAMTPEVCYAYTRAFIQAMETDGTLKQGSDILLAGDLRPSTPRILVAVAKAVEDAGFNAVYTGRLPSPAVAFHAIQHNNASIMVTGSHIPDDRNGIKFNRPEGEILKRDEAMIREQTVTLPEPFPVIDEKALPPADPAAERAYLARYEDFFGPDALAGMRVGVYQHSGVARDLLVTILQALGAEVMPLARSDIFIPVDTEAIREEDIALGRQWAAEQGFDAVISTDGDADRPLISDEQGEWLRGDVVGVLCARFLGIQTLVTPVSSNSVVEACGGFDEVFRTRIGSPYVIEQMNQALAAGATRVAGYEANGGFLLASDIALNGKTLKALPTRDAVLPMLAILASAHQQGLPVSQQVAALPPRFTASDRLKAFPTELSRQKIEQLAASDKAIEAMFGDLCDAAVQQTDQTDGLRITFENGEIVHLRPSGNAPELRCYNEAASQQRVQALNRECMGRLAGWR
ncbi:phosphomannomutase [Thiogranum longum]|uniref:Phosphomannomutase n=1 Tax=Thiogranum longum TaxID=1537524 RepID=A0A4R1HBW8_9GAMM|nr:phosphomannomutase [Thiogranum longum]TCK19487.1 phosphomannomutase [Thiogranum longum]